MGIGVVMGKLEEMSNDEILKAIGWVTIQLRRLDERLSDSSDLVSFRNIVDYREHVYSRKEDLVEEWFRRSEANRLKEGK